VDIARVGGGFEYWPNKASLVLSGDTGYRARTAETNNPGVVKSAQISTQLPADATGYVRTKLSLEGSTNANEKALAFLMHLGVVEAEGDFQSYPGFDSRDEYAGGHYGIIDIFA
jgi:hypothetical protein